VSPLTSALWEHHSPPRSEVASLRRGLALSLCWGSVVVIAVVALVAALGQPDAGTIVVIAVASLLAVSGLVLRRRRVGMWLSLIALAVVVALGIASPDTRVDVLVMGTYTVVFFAIFLTSRPWGLACIAVGTLVMVAVVGRSDVRVDVGAVSIDVGMVAVLQMVVAGAWLWWAWHSAIDTAAQRDAAAAEQVSVIADAVAVQERTRAWLEGITRTHETILNDLRYVLRTPAIDRDRLREQLLTTLDRRSSLAGAAAPTTALGARLTGEFHGTVEVHDATGGPTSWVQALQPVLVEIVRNISRHTDAARIDITLEDRDGVRRVTVTDDGTTPSAHAATTPGIGRLFVVEEVLESLGAHLDEAAHITVITLPSTEQDRIPIGRVLPLLLSVVLASSALGGSPQFLLLLAGASLTYLPVTLAACAVTAIGVITVLRRRPATSALIALATLAAATVTWGITLAQPVCAMPALTLTTINLSLNAFFAVLLWARNGWAWLLTLPVLAGVLAGEVLTGVECPVAGVDILLSSAVLMPVLIVMSWLSTRSTARWEARDRRLWEAEITELARAEAGIDLARALGDSVDRAWAQMWEIAEGADLDDARRRRLRTVESSIRASLQVDPRQAGGFVLAARHVVAAAGAVGVPVHVRALRASADPRPLDPDIVRLFTRLVTTHPDAGASIHSFYDGRDDYLALTTSAAAAESVGVPPGWTGSDGERWSAEVDYVGDEHGPDAQVTVLVWRTSTVVEPEPAVVG
jgi:hypothetical protein